MEKSTNAHCATCATQRRFIARKPNHALHITLTVFTVGLWGLFVYLPLVTLRSQRFRCTECGSTM